MANRITIALPPSFSTSVTGSFARWVMTENYPAILHEFIERACYPQQVVGNLEHLLDDLVSGTVPRPECGSHLYEHWIGSGEKFFGGSWLSLPSYWGESYFFNRLMKSIDFFSNDPWHSRDPFAEKKVAEYRRQSFANSVEFVDQILEDAENASEARMQRVLLLSLLGNKADLSHRISGLRNDAMFDLRDQSILANDCSAFQEFLHVQKPNKVIFCVDNVGEELLFDVAFALVLTQDCDAHVEIHFKDYPFFVSDATPTDFHAFVAELPLDSVTRKALVSAIRDGRLRIFTHWFYTSSFHYFEAPDDIWARFADAQLVILKGDLHYRRLLGDARWSHTDRFQDIVSYFCTNILALRVMKSDLAVGIPDDIARRLEAAEPSWRSNGAHSVIHFHGL